MTDVVRSFIGIALLLGIGVLLSMDRKHIRWRTVSAALAVQMAIGAFVLFIPFGKDALTAVAGGVTHVLEYGFKGSFACVALGGDGTIRAPESVPMVNALAPNPKS